MANVAVVKTGGKQYIVKEGDLLTVDRIDTKEKTVDLEALALFSDDGSAVEVGTPVLDKKIKAEVVGESKGEKIRVAKFKSKVRYRKVRGYRHSYTTLKVGKIQ
jgi:large subunit ribosomal protein L21